MNRTPSANGGRDRDPAVRVSVVVIGRNEGARLSRCLASVQAADWTGVSHDVTYVDSCSSDDSVARARAAGARVHVVADGAPSAAKARNLGWRDARGEFVLFLDGDTELHPQFVGRALAAIDNPGLCAVWGHRRESDPRQSIYTRVLDLDWVYPTGRTLYFGGDALVRRAALEAVGGFDPALKAGEEPELCARLRAAGWAIEHIDAPMTTHDLGIRSLRAYIRRAYRSGVAYADVAARMRARGDVLWQREARRDFSHGWLYGATPLVLCALLLWAPSAAGLLGLVILAVLVRTAMRCAWKAPGQPLLCGLYAVHSHAQKVPALFGQLHAMRARRSDTSIGLVEYRETAGSLKPSSRPLALRTRLKGAVIGLLVPAARAWRTLVTDRWVRLWCAAQLRESTGRALHASNVILGAVQTQGSANIKFGRRALVYPGVCLETQGAGVIEIGDDVVLSRGVHIVAHDRVTLGPGTMVGEYTSLRDANHRRSDISVRDSGHDAAPIEIDRNVWIGRGVTVLKGTRLGASCVVAANAVVTRDVAAGAAVGGVPARLLPTQTPAFT